jgi:hypothetical protein
VNDAGVRRRWRRKILRVAQDDDGCAAVPRPCLGVKLVVYNRVNWSFGRGLGHAMNTKRIAAFGCAGAERCHPFRALEVEGVPHSGPYGTRLFNAGPAGPEERGSRS